MNEDLLNEINMQLAEVGQAERILSELDVILWLGTCYDLRINETRRQSLDEVLTKLAGQDLHFFSTWARFSVPDLTDAECAKLYETLKAITTEQE